MNKRRCAYCQIRKPLSDFYFTIGRKRKSICKRCTIAFNEWYRQQHRNRVKQHQRQYYAAHRKERIARCIQYQQDHPEKVREWKRNYYVRHREEILEKRKESRACARLKRNDTT